MGYVVRMPKLGLEMERGELLEWRVGEGDAVEEGEVVAEIESEKTTAEIEAREAGVLRATYLAVGEAVEPGTPIGIVAAADEDIGDLEATVAEELEGVEAGAETEGEAGAETEAEAEAGAPDATAGGASASAVRRAGDAGGGREAPKATPRAEQRAEDLGVDLAAVEGTGYEGAITEEDVEAAAESGGAGDADAEDVRASPRAERRAEELGVSLAGVEGTGPGGAITEGDVESAAESAGATEAEGTTADAPADVHPTLTVREAREFSGMRSAIARRLGESYREAVHVTEHRTVDAEALFDARDAARDALDADVSVTDVLLVALSAALESHPEFNATFEDGVHRIYEEHNVCLAVDVEAGLVAPALRDIGDESVDTLAEERAALTERTLAGDYTSDDLSGGTFTVTNLGVLGVESFDPVINPPQVAILGVNAVERRPVARDGEVEIRRQLPLDLSFDHRVVDGADAARFLGTLVDRLEDPWPLLQGTVERPSPGERDGGQGSGAEPAPSPDLDLDLPERDVTATADGTLGGTVSIGGVEWRFDVPTDAGGDGTGPTPVDMFLGSLASCLSTTVRIQAERSDVALDDIDVRARATPERGWVETVTVELHLDSDEDDATLDRVVELGERNCYVLDALREDLDCEVTWRRV